MSRLLKAAGAALALSIPLAGLASDHLDTPSVIADPRTDIGDIYAWTSTDGRRLNLVMTIVGRSFSDQTVYTFHIDSGATVGKTGHSATLRCTFPTPGLTHCEADGADQADGDASQPQGLASERGRFRVFAGLRDDPFFNNVKGTRAAYSVAMDALKRGTPSDAAGCPLLSREQSDILLNEWRHTAGGPPVNFLNGWTSSAIVVSIDLPLVNRGGKLLAVWGATVKGGRQVDRAGRPLTGNALLGTIGPAEVSDALKEQYNAATPSTSAQFVGEISKGLALYDSFDGDCGNQWLIQNSAPPGERYHALAALLADDRLWVNSAARDCTQLFAVELAYLSGQRRWRGDCGGRTPNYNAVNEYRSLLVNGTTQGVDDGVTHDDMAHSADVFPFLAAPQK